MRLIVISLFAASFFAAAGCGSGTVRAAALKPTLDRTLDRHDAYLETGKKPDGSALSDLEKRVWLRDSRLLRETVDEAASE